MHFSFNHRYRAGWPAQRAEFSRSIVARTPPSGQVTDERAETEGDGNDLVRILAHGLVGGFGALHGLVANAAIDFFAVLQRGGEALAGLPDLFPGDIGGGGY